MEDSIMGVTPSGTSDGGTPDGAPRAATAPSDGIRNGAPVAPQTFDQWLEAQPDDVRSLVGNNVSGLKNALDAERRSRKDIEKQLRDAARKLEDGSADVRDHRKALEETAARLQATELQASFYDQAHVAGVTNLRLAYLAASEASLIDKNGKCDFKTLQAQYPELFSAKDRLPAGNAGSGTGSRAPGADMNTLIRQAAGHR